MLDALKFYLAFVLVIGGSALALLLVVGATFGGVWLSLWIASNVNMFLGVFMLAFILINLAALIITIEEFS